MNVQALNTVKVPLGLTLDGAIFHKSLRSVPKHSASHCCVTQQGCKENSDGELCFEDK